MATGKAAGASAAAKDSGQAPAEAQPVEETPAAPAEAPSAEEASAAEIAALREQLAQAQALAEEAADEAAEERERAAKAEAEKQRVLSERGELEHALQAAEAAAHEELPPPALNDRLADVLEALGQQLADRGVEQAAIRPGESAESVMASLEGKVSLPTHSGRKAAEPVVFISKGANLRIVKRARIRYTDARGQLVVTEGEHIPFEPDGRFETDDLDVIEFLKARPAFGSEFWEMGHDPHAAPDPAPVLETILAAALELDDERLASIEAQEATGLKRDVVLKQVKAARARVQGLAPGGVAEGDEDAGAVVA